MAELIMSRRGEVAVMPTDSTLARIKVRGFNPVNAIIESIGIGLAVNVQFMKSLDEAVYVYSFGDEMGNVKVSGKAFAKSCEARSAGDGLSSIFDYYQRHRASKRKAPVHIALPDSAITMQGFLIGSHMALTDPIFGFWSFDLSFVMLSTEQG